VIAKAGSQVVGILSFNPSSGLMPENMGVGAIEVHAGYRGSQISQKMLIRFFRVARKGNKGIRMSGYTTKGARSIKPYANALAMTMDIPLYEASQPLFKRLLSEPFYLEAKGIHGPHGNGHLATKPK